MFINTMKNTNLKVSIFFCSLYLSKIDVKNEKDTYKNN